MVILILITKQHTFQEGSPKFNMRLYKNLGLFFLISCCSSSIFSQIPKGKIAVGLNPLSLAEPFMNLGPCLEYQITPHFAFWTEASFIFQNSYLLPERWKNMKGFRFILQPRYFLGQKKIFFMAAEFRMVSHQENNALSFVNRSTADTLHNYAFKQSQSLYGGAVLVGWQLNLSRKKNIFIEITTGIGAKQRFIERKNIPAGYAFEIQRVGFGLSPHYEYDNDGTAYFPIGIRLMKSF